MDQSKVTFLKKDFVYQLKHLAPDAPPKWGKMNGQQMVEHFVHSVKVASGKVQLPDVYNEEQMQKGLAWVMTDKPFRENTVNPALPGTPAAPLHATMQQSIEELQQELNYFFDLFEKKPGLRIRNFLFGDMNFEEQVQLLYKHAQHHLKQFGLIS
jgi:hypothetical protein